MSPTAIYAARSDEELVELHRYGDDVAFEAIYSRFEAMVYQLALRMSADPEEAADTTQEVFLRVHRHLRGFAGRSSLKTWIFRIAVNCCRSRLKRRARKRRLFVGGGDERLAVWADRRRSPERRTVERDLAQRIAAHLADLDPRYREAIILRDLQGLSYREIGEVLNLRLGTVRSRIARGREQLRALLEPAS